MTRDRTILPRRQYFDTMSLPILDTDTFMPLLTQALTYIGKMQSFERNWQHKTLKIVTNHCSIAVIRKTVQLVMIKAPK